MLSKYDTVGEHFNWASVRYGTRWLKKKKVNLRNMIQKDVTVRHSL